MNRLSFVLDFLGQAMQSMQETILHTYKKLYTTFGYSHTIQVVDRFTSLQLTDIELNKDITPSHENTIKFGDYSYSNYQVD